MVLGASGIKWPSSEGSPRKGSCVWSEGDPGARAEEGSHRQVAEGVWCSVLLPEIGLLGMLMCSPIFGVAISSVLQERT